MKRLLKAVGLTLASLALPFALVALMMVLPPVALALVVGTLVFGCLTAVFYQVVS